MTRREAIVGIGSFCQPAAPMRPPGVETHPLSFPYEGT